MIRRTVPAAAVAALFLAGSAVSAEAQSGASALSAEELEAQAMGLELAFACSPRRHGEATGSTSTIRREADALAGRSVYFRSIEGTFLALEEYNDTLDGHCLVFGWWGGELVPGTYPVARLSMRAMEEEETSGEHSFFAWGAVRTPSENIMILIESGSLAIETFGPGGASGTFEISGFVPQGNARGPAFHWSGSFRAVEGQPL